jgi:GNAT superfamily N-acetyltransferase
MPITFKHLVTLEERITVFQLYCQLNDTLDLETFIKRMESLGNTHYQLLAMYNEAELVAISGYWVGWKLYCGKYLEPDNVVVDEAWRSKGLGEKLQIELERIANLNGCLAMMLDAYMGNVAGHKFYERHGYEKKGYHFVKTL